MEQRLKILLVPIRRHDDVVGLLGHVVVVILFGRARVTGHRHVPRVLIAVADVGFVEIHVRRGPLAGLHVSLGGVDGGDLDLRDGVLRRRVFHVGRQILVLLVVETRLLLPAGD